VAGEDLGACVSPAAQPHKVLVSDNRSITLKVPVLSQKWGLRRAPNGIGAYYFGAAAGRGGRVSQAPTSLTSDPTVATQAGRVPRVSLPRARFASRCPAIDASSAIVVTAWPSRPDAPANAADFRASVPRLFRRLSGPLREANRTFRFPKGTGQTLITQFRDI
jgi:hypothetical protein